MKEYEKAGVSISRGDEFVRRIKSLVRSTFSKDNPNANRVLSDIGHFGAFFDINFNDLKNPVLVSSVDGVGTKLKVAILMNKHDTIGQDLVNHCVNDILCSGAKPLFFLDYLAFGKMNLEVAEQIMSGLSKACRENECALIGGETAEMPDLYQENDYDISGTIVGIVERDKIIDGKKISPGDVLIGLKSSGLHTNGYSLARKVLLKKFRIDDFVDELGCTLGEELLKIHRSYFKIVYPLLDKFQIKGLSHITGGGIIGNTRRIISEGLTIWIDWNSWSVPPIFELIQKTGNVSDEEMREVFNLGIGMVLIVNKMDVEKVQNELKNSGEQTFIIGEIR
ncbi:MAG: phosphoribosylformylglycinamidine cyclo-ligase [Ignavibacteria bacterium]|jgi:phosphoribosylformylglycinamidine cyclo-ligase|nr:phosphoribosylformylglycinamidine cyclo-ligase [Ignavibacteria bacterium]MDH7526928.1 phosphoribosylformylglycinamidine cyclo-ligase [Ignavibacteria bacterium]